MMTENADEIATTSAEPVRIEGHLPVHLADETYSTILTQPQSGPRGLFVYSITGLCLVIAGALLGWASATRPTGIGLAPVSVSTPSPLLSETAVAVTIDMNELIEQVLPAKGHTLPFRYADIGPQLLDAGAIDFERLVDLYEDTGRPLSAEQRHILTEGSDELIHVDSEHSHFLLNLFWALGLTNRNSVLTEGPMVQYGENGIGGYASTGGWILGTRTATDLYASQLLVHLTPEQQANVEEVAALIFRPCCDNPTLFPDCNHGMAMLGLLELMASQGASTGEMLTTAKTVNAYWFPQQTLELAVFFKVARASEYADIAPRTAVGIDHFSYSGYTAMRQWLSQNGVLDQLPGQGASCGVG